ncbi:hypothetical protein D3C76_1771180 [compost metagenome]
MGHFSNRIDTNFSAAGDSEAPRRYTKPRVRVTCGSISGTLTSVGWSAVGMARLGMADTPSPASTMPSDVDKCCTS